MRDYAILSDGTCDLSDELASKYGIEIVAGHLCTPSKEEFQCPPRWDRFTSKEFYQDLRKHPNGYTTSPASIAELENAMEAHVRKGEGVIYVTMSSGMSGSYNFASMARNNILERYPDARIYVLDSLRFGPAVGLLDTDLSILRSEGKSMDDAARIMEERKNTYHQAGWLDDLSFVASKGRLTHAKAFMGTLIGVKPIGEFDYNGMTTVLGKAKGAKNAYRVLIGYMRETILDPENQTIFIAQSDRLEAAQEYKKLIEREIRPREVIINDVYPLTGANVGPGLMAAYYRGTPISKDLSKERAIIERLLKEA